MYEPQIRRNTLRYLLFIIVVVAIGGSGTLHASADAPLWIRYPAISPDGKQIVFVYRGDLWLVSSEGGRARQLTTHEDYEKWPVWSPDSKQIAFASDRHGNDDVFVMSAEGGSPERLTFHSATDTPTSFSPDGKSVLFTSARQDAPQATIGDSSLGELYRVSVGGGRPQQILTTPSQAAVTSPDGTKIAYYDRKGYEDAWRKHHVSSITRDIWIYDLESGEHTKLTSFRGEDRDPVWSADGETLYFLSQQSGTFNVFKTRLDEPGKAEQISSHETHPVRFLSGANDGTLAYWWNGQVWIKPANAEQRPVAMKVTADDRSNPIETLSMSGGCTDFAVSPNEEEIALILRGEVFVTSVEYATTKRVTYTPQQERGLAWSADGRSVYYASERDGAWNLYKTSITREEEDRFFSATLLTEDAVLVGEDESFQPLMSPDGKKIAYLHDRDEIRVMDVGTRKTSTLVPARLNYSYSDGDIGYDWSPDSKWLAFNYHAHNRWLEDVGVVNVATGKISNITNSGYEEGGPRWGRDGKSLLFISNRLGRRDHGSWGSDTDIFSFYLTRDAWDFINLSKEEMELRKKKKEKEEKKKDKAKKEKGKNGDKEQAADKTDSEDDEDEKNQKDDDDKEQETKEKEGDKKVDPIKIDFSGIDDRVKRISFLSASIGGYDIAPDGETVVYFAKIDKSWALWSTRIRDQDTSKLATLDSGSVVFAKDGKSVFVRSGSGQLSKVTVPESGKGEVKGIAYRAEMNLDLSAERAYIFEHAWRQVKRKFYEPGLHDVPWAAMKENYAAFLPSIGTTEGFVELLSELLGELNASHTGARYRPRRSGGDQTPAFGLLFDIQHHDAGLKVAEVLRGGPFDVETSKVKPGVLITHIDGIRLTPDVNPNRLMNTKGGKKVRLGLTNLESGSDWEEVFTPIGQGQQSGALYERWIKGRRDLVDKLSDGRVGYVHVAGMNDSSFRRFYKDVLG
ncbi:MAG: hypothetical protein WBF93_11435, partial [Pirellulales bacterium]